jgi:hypothetical protein
VASPLIVLTGTSTVGIGPTLADLRHELADQLGLYAQARISAVPSGGDTTRYALSDDLRDDESARPFERTYLYVADGAQAGAQARIARDGYLGPLSAVRLARPLPATLDVNTSVEVTSPLPVKRYLDVKGLNDCIDEALARLPATVLLTFTGNGTGTYSLAAYDWLASDVATLGLYDTLQQGATLPPTLSPRPYRIVGDGATRSLRPSWNYGSGTTFYLAAQVRADRLISDGTTWAYTTFGTRGLRNRDTYQCAADPRWVLVWAMVKALAEVRKILLADRSIPGDEKGPLLEDVARRINSWGTAAKRIIAAEFPKPISEPTAPLVAGTVMLRPGTPLSSGWPG